MTTFPPGGSGRAGRVAAFAYRLALRAFPPHHRDRYEVEMLDVFERELSARRDLNGTWAVVAFSLRACADAVAAGLGERRRAAGSTPLPFAGLGHDLTHAARGLVRSWIFTGVSLLSLACGLGIVMALFLLLRVTIEPPIHVDEDRLAEVLVLEGGRVDEEWAYPDFVDVADGVGSVRLAGWARSSGMLHSGEEAGGRQTRTAFVSPTYFDVLGVSPAMGRAFTDADGALSGSTPVVITDEVWETWLASDPDVIGRILTIDRTPHVVVGVAPPYFKGHRAGLNAHIFVPLDRHPALAPDSPARFDRAMPWVRVIARGTEGTSVSDADAAIATLMSGLAADHPETNSERAAIALPYAWQGARVHNTEGLIIRGIFGGIQGLVLLVVCLNIGGMVLVRSATRERELAMRIAIGSSRWRLVQYLMAESVIIGVTGGLLVIGVLQVGLAFAARGVGAPPESVVVDAPVMAVCLGLSVLASAVFGLMPALRFSRASLVSSMRDGGGGRGQRSGRIHRIAVAGQVALAVPVLIVAGSVTHGAQSMTTAEYGVRGEGLMISDRLDLTPQGYSPAQVQGLARSVRSEVASLPGATAATVSDQTPLDATRADIPVTSPVTGSTTSTRVAHVDEHFFSTMEIPILRGRAISEDDVAGGDLAAVVTESLAARLFEGNDPLGERLSLHLDENGTTEEFTVVGVAGDVAGPWLESDTDNVFLSYWQRPGGVLTVTIRATSEDESLAAAVGDVVVALDPGLAAPAVRPFSVIVEDRGRDMPIWSVFFSVISVLLLGLSALGIYGIVAFAVARRTREIGVRMSLGATKSRVLEGVLVDAVKLAAPGLVVGSVLGVVVGQRILNQSYAQIGLPMAEPGIMFAGALGALAVVVVASLSPARRAAGVDPMEALRTE